VAHPAGWKRLPEDISPRDPADRVTTHRLPPRRRSSAGTIRGLRVTVSLILNLAANGMTPEEIVEAYPYLDAEDVHEALRYAAWLAEEQVIPAESIAS
jgi:uncharacterized protein (DUF433 family)